MVNQPQDVLSIVKLQGVSKFSSHTLSFGGDLICMQNWMVMGSFLSSPVVGTFWSKKV